MATSVAADYSARSITVLEGLTAVRNTPGMYIGSTGHRGLHHLVWEVVDNAVDEALAGVCDHIEVTLTGDGGVRVSDNGRGIPVDEHETERRPALEVVMTTLHAGGKFGSDSYVVSGGLHGVGVSVVNALSRRLEAVVVRDGHRYRQAYERGEPVGPMEQVGRARGHGTTIAFWPDPEIFEDVNFGYAIISTRMRETAFLNAGLAITVTDEREEPHTERYEFKEGLRDFVAHLNSTKEPVHPSIISFSGETDTSQVEVAMQWNSSYNDSLYTFANTINTVDGGTHDEGFRAALTSTINRYARANGLLKEKDPNLSGDDAREGLTAIVSVKLRKPQFESQTKTKLGNTDIKSFVQTTSNKALDERFEENNTQITAIGTNIGEDFDLTKTHYNKVVIMADADVDGPHIRTLLLTFLFRFLRKLVESSFVYIAQPPLYKIKYERGAHDVFYAYTEREREQWYKRNSRSKAQPQRYKGLGEMNPEELWETTMDPERRTLLQVGLEDAAVADEIFTILMGENVENRRNFIQRNAKDVRFLDI